MRTEEIIIPACSEHEGYFVIRTKVPWYCIFCGAERGEPFEAFSYDGSRRLNVSAWKNPCGHLETYSTVREWIKW